MIDYNVAPPSDALFQKAVSPAIDRQHPRDDSPTIKVPFQNMASTPVGEMSIDIQRKLDSVMNPEGQGKRSIQMEPTILDDISRIGGQTAVLEGKSSIIGDMAGAFQNMAKDVGDAKLSLTQALPKQSAIKVPEPEPPSLQARWTPQQPSA